MGDIYADGGVSSYPTDLDTRTAQVDATPTLAFSTSAAMASKMNEVADAVIAVQTKVGTTAQTGTSAGIIFHDGTRFDQHTDLEWDDTTGFLQIGSPGSTVNAAAGDFVMKNNSRIRFANVGATATLNIFGVNASNQVIISQSASDIIWGVGLVALGGGSAPTLGTIGGSGPATAGQDTWMRILDNAGVPFWVPAWK